ncbi:granulysin [Manis javanica]|uniref:granulysin n=1 Tax=Manis javanica TaxID=9974 RepID=UPI0008133B8B|nr:granulysin [Manis javanica]KAI5939810.1 Granulysin [Manis javanica]
MTSWALLLLASVLLATPGLTFSGLTPEGSDPVTADLCGLGEPFCQDQSGPQSDLLTNSEGLGIICLHCRKIIRKLEKMVGENPTEDTIRQTASRVCRKMKLLYAPCKKMMKSSLRFISRDIMAGKPPQAVCVDLRICKPEAGLF